MSRRSTMTLAVAAAHLLLAGPAIGQAPKDKPTAQKPADSPQVGAQSPADAPASEAVTSEATPVSETADAPAAASSSGPPTATVGAPARPMSLADAGYSVAPAPQPAPARQDALQTEEEPPGPGEPLGSYQRHLQLVIGVRTSFVTDDDYRLFSRTVDRLSESFPMAQLSLGAGGTVWKDQALSLLVVGFWDYGGSASSLRGEKTDLDVHRLSLGAELRHHYFPWLYSMARLAPAAIDVRASLNDRAADTMLYRRKWSFGVDVSVGGAAELFGPPSATSQRPRLWALAEVGYGWAHAVDLTFRADDGAPQRMDALSLGKLAIRGPMFRISGAMTFF